MPPDLLSAGQLAPLRHAALEAAAQAYAPYSRFRVGAALLLEDGSIVAGANVENSSYGLTICAERSAIVRAVAEKGPGIRIHAIAITNLNRAPGSPCGACRQVMGEFMNGDALVLFPGAHGEEVRTFDELLPLAFRLA